jgi:hypothetical protein
MHLLAAEQQTIQVILDKFAGTSSFGQDDEWIFDEILDAVPQRSDDDESQSGWLNACRAIALAAVRAKCLSPKVADRALARAWSLDNRPEDVILASEWIAAFEVTGFTSDPDEPFERPSNSRRVWRGATLERSRGLAWTTNVWIARNFASDLQARGEAGRLWVATTPPGLVMARYNRSEEAEWVINTQDLHVVEVRET